MFNKTNTIICLLLILALPLCFSCRKDRITTSPSAKLSFQEDTVKFDTVFTTLGSATRSLKIYNPNNEKINISNISLAGGTGSMFRMNVDGTPTYSINNIQIAAHDSLYIFVAVTVNPQNPSNPFLVTDSILFNTNGNNQKIILDAYGQNAHFYNDSTICNQHWTNDLPYVIFNSILIDSDCSLTIDSGVRIYMHYGSNIYVGGTLTINGTTNNSVTFQVDRLEQDYKDIPGQWGSIIFLRGSKVSTITHAVINESYSGIVAGFGSQSAKDTLASNYPTSAPNVTINQCTIKNCLNDGLYGIFSTINVNNTLIYSCGQDNVGLIFGGTYNFNNCTLADFSSATTNHTLPVVYVQNFFPQNGSNYVSSFTGNFNNTIVYGDISGGNEIVDTIESATFNLIFNNSLVTVKNTPKSTSFNSCLVNENPLFVNSSNDDYELTNGSPCIGAGNPSSELPTDILGVSRSKSPDIGCYEYPQ